MNDVAEYGVDQPEDDGYLEKQSPSNMTHGIYTIFALTIEG